MATIIARPSLPPIELPEPSAKDDNDLVGMRLGTPFHLPFLRSFGVATQTGTIWLGTWGLLSVAFFLAGTFVLIWAGVQQMQGNVWEYVKHFANVQILPPDTLGMAPTLNQGGWWEINMLLWAASVVCWAGRCYDRLVRFHWRPYLLFAWLSAILLTSTIWVYRPMLMGSWAEAPGLGLNSDLDWAQNFSVLWGNLYYNPWHMLAIFFLFGSTMLWGMHGATILATAAEGSYMEDAEIKDMHSGSHKSMLFWRWVMGFNANPKTIHDWLWWFGVGTVLSSALGIIVTGTVVKDWYVWGVDHGWVQQYGPITRSAQNGMPRAFVPNSSPDTFATLQQNFDEYRPISLDVHFATASASLDRAPSQQSLEQLAALMKAEPDTKIVIEGHTDSVGNPAANLVLSKQRADAVKAELVSTFGIAADRMQTAGYGDTRPVASNEDEGGRAQNRRVDVTRVGS